MKINVQKVKDLMYYHRHTLLMSGIVLVVSSVGMTTMKSYNEKQEVRNRYYQMRYLMHNFPSADSIYLLDKEMVSDEYNEYIIVQKKYVSYCSMEKDTKDQIKKFMRIK